METTRERWIIQVSAHTHLPNGKRVRMCRYIEAGGDTAGGMLRAVLKRKDPSVFLGCEIHGLTPLGQTVIRVLEERFGRYFLDRRGDET